jgi:leukotriene-A4 hydrolase
MPQPIPSYLLAIAAGDIASKQVGPRSYVWTEPGRLDAVANEFERHRGDDRLPPRSSTAPMRWGRYDMLVLPPSFPFGGMENPRLSFLTPTLIAGDKSLVNVVAHELAHSWSGNLATNATWQRPVAQREFHQLRREPHRRSGVRRRPGADGPGRRPAGAARRDEGTARRRTSIWCCDLAGRDPDDAFSGVPYQKGEWMLRTLERRFGREQASMPSIRAWFDEHAFQSVSTAALPRISSATRLLDAKDAADVAAPISTYWLYQAGVPKSALLAHSAKLEAIDGALADFIAGKKDAAALNARTWVTAEWVHFLNGYSEKANAAQMAALDAAYGLTQRRNREIAMRWFLAGIRAGYTPMRDALRAHLIEIGRRKLMMPLWSELAKTPENKAWAIEVYRTARAGLHPIAQNSVDTTLGYKP